MQKRNDASERLKHPYQQVFYEDEKPKRQKSFGELWSLFLLKVRIRKRYYILLSLVTLILVAVLTSEAFFDKVLYVSVIWIHRLENFYNDMPWHLVPFFSVYQRFSMVDKFEIQDIVHRGSDSFCTIHDEVPLLINMRVPKTAGTTVTDLLQELSSPNHFSVSVTSRLHPNSKQELDAREKDLAFYFTSFQHKTAQSGHVRFLDFAKHGHPEPLYIGTFRDPVERMQSHYHYDSFAERPFYVDYKLWVKGQVGVVKPTLTQCVRKFIGMKIFPSDVPFGTDGFISDPKIKEKLKRVPKEYTCLQKKYINVQLKYYCGYHRHCKTLETSHQMLRIALDNLARFQVVMLTDKMHQSVHLLEKMIPNYFRGSSHIYENYEKEMEDQTDTAVGGGGVIMPDPYSCSGPVMRGTKRRYCPCNGTLYYGRKFAENGDRSRPLSLYDLKASSDFITADVRKMGGMHCTHRHRAFQGGFARDPAPKIPKQCICEPMPAHDAHKFKFNEIFHMRSNVNTNMQTRIEMLPYDVKDYLDSFLRFEISLYEEVKKHFQNNVERCGV
jgi:hypothetical protein